MSADQVIALAEKDISDNEKKQIGELEIEVAKLETRKNEIESKKAILEKFVPSNERFYWSKSSFIEQSVIELDVTNNAEFAVSRVYCRGVVVTPSRAVPWIDEDFNFSVPGGIEPSETRSFSLNPVGYEWDNKEVKKRDDTVFTVTIVNIEDAKGEKILSYEDQRIEEKLGELKEQLAKLKAKHGK